MLGWLSSIAQGFGDFIESFAQGIAEIGNWFGNLFSSLGGWFSDLFSNLGNWFGNLFDGLGGWFSDLFRFFGVLLNYLNPFHENFIGRKIVELFKALFEFIFIPSEDCINNLVNTVKSKFSFVDAIKTAANSYKNILNNNLDGVGSLSVDIDCKYYVGNVTIFNLGWYAKFKRYGDLVFTGFAYAFFIWRIYIKLPGIISGTSGIIGRNGGEEK